MPDTLTTVLVILASVAIWGGIVLYARRTYYLEGCGACGGSGKQWEPIWMALCRLTRTRRFRPCPACGGAGKFDIHAK